MLRVTRRVLPVGLVLVSLAAGAQGQARLAFFLLVAAVPAGAVAALTVLGELLDASPNDPAWTVLQLELLLGAAGLALLVGAAALRGDGGPVPPLSAAALGACVAVFVAQAVVWLVPLARPADRQPGPARV